MAFLFTVVGANISEKFELDSPGRNTYIIGRDADIRISDPAISNRHAELISLEGNWIVRDLGTPAGTFVNNKKLSAAIKLKDNDQVRCGSTILLFSQHIARPQPQKLEKTPELPVSRDQFDSTFVQAIDLALQEVQDPKELLARAAKALFQNEVIDCIYIVSKDGRSELQVALEIKRPGTDCVLYSGIVEQALADLKPVYVDEVSKYRSSRSVYHEGSLRCVAAVPVIAKNSVKSVLYIGSCKANAFANGYTAILGYNGWYLGLALENIALIQAAKQNQRLTDAGQTAANMSHTIKNIVQSIGGATEVIDYAFESGKFDRARNSWGILRKNLDRIRKFALDMLAFSRDSKAILTDCMFNKIVESAIESLNSKAGEKGVSLALEMDENIPRGQMDVDKIHDVVLNLVMNAIDAVEENKGIIKVHTEYLTDKKMLRLSVKDNGPGIKPEDLDKVFLPFHTTKAKTGTGLGLAICKRVVEQHGGTISVESELGEGAAFIILIPVNEN